VLSPPFRLSLRKGEGRVRVVLFEIVRAVKQGAVGADDARGTAPMLPSTSRGQRPRLQPATCESRGETLNNGIL
jgi:hypothetical protein